MINILMSCSSPALWSTLNILQKTFTLIQIVAPILLIVSLIMTMVKIVNNPEDKKLVPKIKNAFLATVIIFFIPVIVNVVMNVLGENYTISSCWNSIGEETSPTEYVDDTDGSRKKIYDSSESYEK